MSDKIICRINDEPKIKIHIHDEPTIKIKFTEQGLKGDKGATGATGANSIVPGPTGPTGSIGPTGPAGTTDHALLSNLDFDNSGHIGFQKKMIYDPDYKTYLVE
jgi:hypothetical protein